ncbi:trypsin-like serine peptidase [Nonomuraea sp. NPDC050022]|uniref:trypsin-like serine peptidase n=1 Tax=unclassified Nonomuraea TaxID=2593643 RepID=UPI0034101D93
MSLSTPLLTAVPLVTGLMGPALIGAMPVQHHDPAHRVAKQVVHTAKRTEVVEHVAARSPAEQRRVLDYWTPARMADALPIDMLGIVTKRDGLLGGLAKKTGIAAAPGLTGEKVTGEKVTGEKVTRESEKARIPVPRFQSARPLTTTSGSRWLTGGAVTRTTGRVFLTVSGIDFVCSASTVKSASRDLVVTAGHCVKDGTGEWAANWQFVPGYRDGGGHPYGQYAARRMFVTGPWAHSADDSYDVGMVALTTAESRHVTDVVGGQQIAFNGPRGGQTFGFGFPADPPYDGEHLVYCAGRLHGDPYKQTRDQGLGCDMTAGSSGGPWLSGFDPATGTGEITSLSSFKYSDDQRTMYGPYFGDAAKALFDTAQRA